MSTYKIPTLFKQQFMVVGCGGTGGFVAEGLCRMFSRRSDFALELVDKDIVEDRNLIRQNFYKEDLGRFKSQVLAERFSRQYGIIVGYSTAPVETLPVTERGFVTIGCVDNPEAREILQYAGRGMLERLSYCYFGGWYIDAGNDEYTGQVLIGNQLARKSCQKAFVQNTSHPEDGGTCTRLPLPQVQEPGLLAPQPKKQISCAEAVQRDEQSPVINQMMANLVLTFVHKLVSGTLDWMQAYIDLNKGTLTTVPITPERVSRITGDSVRQLEYRPRPERVRVRV
jgi:hypothetical protein